MAKKQDVQKWWNNHVKEDREATLKRLQERFGNVEAFDGDVMKAKYETYTIFTDALDYSDIAFLKRNLLEIKDLVAWNMNKLQITVTREGTQQ